MKLKIEINPQKIWFTDPTQLNILLKNKNYEIDSLFKNFKNQRNKNELSNIFITKIDGYNLAIDYFWYTYTF